MPFVGYYGGYGSMYLMGDSYILYILGLVVLLIISGIAQATVKSRYRKYSQVSNTSGLTGAQIARGILDANGLGHIDVVPVGGELTDNFNPKTQVVSLSEGVFNSTSVSAMGIAAHECGHAVQHSKHYVPVVIRSALVPVVNFCSGISWWLVIIGILINSFADVDGVGYYIAVVGVILFASSAVFQLVTLPVELNASGRAMSTINQLYNPGQDERKGVRKVLTAAAMTYVAALLMTLLNLFRVIMMVRGSSRRR